MGLLRSWQLRLGALVPELAELLANEAGFLLEHPVPTFLDHAAFRAIRERLGAVVAVRPERMAPSPAHDRDRKLLLRKFRELRRFLRNEGIVVQACPQIPRLPHLHDIALHLVLADRIRIVGEVTEEMTKILLF